MNSADFLDVAVKNLPGGLILVDLQGNIRAINKTAETLLGLQEAIPVQTDCQRALGVHPKIVQVLLSACSSLTPANRRELTTFRPDGEKIVLGYGTLILKSDQGRAIGVGMSFQDITRFIPLMDAHQFLDIALKNLPGGLIFVDLQGKVRGVNLMAERLLALAESVEPGTECFKAFVDHPRVVQVLLSTCQSLKAVNRQEIATRGREGEKLVLGYGTLIIRNTQGMPIGVGFTFQDITRFIPLPLQAEFIRLVDRFFTPFAIIMVIVALSLGYAEPQAQRLAIALAISLAIFNEISLRLARKKGSWALPIGYTRLATNFVANVFLVYLLGAFWGPMWLLFVLTPVATALYADWKKTLLTAVVSAAALLGIYASRGLTGSVGWGQASLHAAFIVFISLFVNSIARMVMQMRSPANANSKPAGAVPSAKVSSSTHIAA